MDKKFLPLLGFACFVGSVAVASGTSVVAANKLKATTITIKVNGKSSRAAIFCLAKVPGAAKRASGGMAFTAFSTTLSQLKAKHVKGTKLTQYTQLASVGKTACTKIANTKPPVQQTGNFDAAGNLTAAGKTAFGVPASVNGNITEGKAISQSYCTCHEERLGKSFPFVRDAISQSPMFFSSTDIPDPMLANIIAYLNRFNS